MGYTYLTTDSRCQIYVLLSIGMDQKNIAEHLGVLASTICRELKKNTGLRSIVRSRLLSLYAINAYNNAS